MNTAVKFFKDIYSELERVQWPAREETIRLTAYVIGASLATGLFVAGIDYLFKEALAFIIK